MAAKKPEKPSAKKAATPAKAGAAKAGASKAGATKAAGAAKGATKTTAAAKKAAEPTKAAAKKAATKPAAASTKPAGPASSKPAGTGAKAVPPERHERERGTPEPRRQATTPPAQQPAPAAAAPLRRLRPTKPTKDMYSPATGTNTSDPFPAKELDKFRQLILDTRAESIEELDMLTEQLREMTAREVGEDNNAYSLHMAEQGTDAMEREKTFLQAQRTSDYVKKLGEALDRIENKSFGICRICGLRLDSKRLLAVPVTQVCTVYKNTSKPCEPGRLHMLETGVGDEDAG